MHTRLLIYLFFFYCSLLASYGQKPNTAQQKPNAPQKIVIDSTGVDFTYTEIREVAKSKDKILEAVQVWAAKKYENHNTALVNKQSGNFVLKTREALPIGKAHVEYTITVDCKEKKYRAVLSNIVLHYTEEQLGRQLKSSWAFFRKQPNKTAQEELLKSAMDMTVTITFGSLEGAITRNNTDF